MTYLRSSSSQLVQEKSESFSASKFVFHFSNLNMLGLTIRKFNINIFLKNETSKMLKIFIFSCKMILQGDCKTDFSFGISISLRLGGNLVWSLTERRRSISIKIPRRSEANCPKNFTIYRI